MTREITLTDSVATTLSERKQDGETYSMTVERLLEETSDEDRASPEGPEQLAQSAMNVSELEAAHSEGMTNEEYLAHEYGLDVNEYGSAESLRAAKTEASR